MGAATVDEGKTAAGTVVGAVAAVATAYVAAVVVAMETAMSRHDGDDGAASADEWMIK